MEENSIKENFLWKDFLYSKKYFFITSGSILFLFILFFLFELGVFCAPYFEGKKTIVIAPGDKATRIADMLDQEGIVRSRSFFLFFISIVGYDRKIKPGSYYVTHSISVPRLVALITSDRAERTIRIHEGWTNFEIASYLQQENIASRKDFLSAATGTEGYLSPDTYQIFQNSPASDLVKRMREEFDNKVTPLMAEIERKKLRLQDIVIMASLIEKESAGNNDRAIISGILWKRLNNNRPLQVDATLSYLLGKESKDLTADDLYINSPYNTYRYPWLPIGPIGNPGLEAIKAALYPQDSPYWFYLHDKTGKAYYAKTFEEHIANKNKYLR